MSRTKLFANYKREIVKEFMFQYDREANLQLMIDLMKGGK
jgi:hypothetical protein